MPIFSDNAPRIKVYANSHQTLSIHGTSAGNKQMQYDNVLYNNGPTGFYSWNGATGYASCLLYTSPSPRDLSTSRMPSSA